MKKILAMVLSVALLATIAITGSVAYFTDTDNATNVFTVGNVVIDQREWERKDQSVNTPGLQPFTQNKPLYPVYGDYTNCDKAQFTDSHQHNITMPKESSFQNYVDKIVDVENKGKSDAYIRTIFAVPTAGMENHDWLHLDWNENSGAWTKVEIPGTATIGGAEYKLYVVTYADPIYGSDTRASDNTKNAYAAPSLLGVWMDSAVDFNAEKDADGNAQYNTDGSVKGKYVMGETELVGDLNLSKILVATQAVQVDGFEPDTQDSAEAPATDDAVTDTESTERGASLALETAFYKVTNTKHPWMDESAQTAGDILDEIDTDNSFNRITELTTSATDTAVTLNTAEQKIALMADVGDADKIAEISASGKLFIGDFNIKANKGIVVEGSASDVVIWLCGGNYTLSENEPLITVEGTASPVVKYYAPVKVNGVELTSATAATLISGSVTLTKMN